MWIPVVPIYVQIPSLFCGVGNLNYECLPWANVGMYACAFFLLDKKQRQLSVLCLSWVNSTLKNSPSVLWELPLLLQRLLLAALKSQFSFTGLNRSWAGRQAEKEIVLASATEKVSQKSVTQRNVIDSGGWRVTLSPDLSLLYLLFLCLISVLRFFTGFDQAASTSQNLVLSEKALEARMNCTYC